MVSATSLQELEARRRRLAAEVESIRRAGGQPWPPLPPSPASVLSAGQPASPPKGPFEAPAARVDDLFFDSRPPSVSGAARVGASPGAVPRPQLAHGDVPGLPGLHATDDGSRLATPNRARSAGLQASGGHDSSSILLGAQHMMRGMDNASDASGLDASGFAPDRSSLYSSFGTDFSRVSSKMLPSAASWNGHADLIQRARAAERETQSAIERVKSAKTSLERSGSCGMYDMRRGPVASRNWPMDYGTSTWTRQRLPTDDRGAARPRSASLGAPAWAPRGYTSASTSDLNMSGGSTLGRPVGPRSMDVQLPARSALSGHTGGSTRPPSASASERHWDNTAVLERSSQQDHTASPKRSSAYPPSPDENSETATIAGGSVPAPPPWSLHAGLVPPAGAAAHASAAWAGHSAGGAVPHAGPAALGGTGPCRGGGALGVPGLWQRSRQTDFGPAQRLLARSGSVGPSTFGQKQEDAAAAAPASPAPSVARPRSTCRETGSPAAAQVRFAPSSAYGVTAPSASRGRSPASKAPQHQLGTSPMSGASAYRSRSSDTCSSAWGMRRPDAAATAGVNPTRWAAQDSSGIGALGESRNNVPSVGAPPACAGAGGSARFGVGGAELGVGERPRPAASVERKDDAFRCGGPGSMRWPWLQPSGVLPEARPAAAEDNAFRCGGPCSVRWPWVTPSGPAPAPKPAPEDAFRCGGPNSIRWSDASLNDAASGPTRAPPPVRAAVPGMTSPVVGTPAAMLGTSAVNGRFGASLAAGYTSPVFERDASRFSEGFRFAKHMSLDPRDYLDRAHQPRVA